MFPKNSSENLFELPEEKLAESCRNSAQLILQNVQVLSELSSQLKKETQNGENYLNSLNHLVLMAGKDVSSLYNCVNSLLEVAKKLVHVSLNVVPPSDPNFNYLKTEAEKLLNTLDEISEDEARLDERLKDIYQTTYLSTKSHHINEKYPEHCSRESLLDKSSLASLPTVPEDAFADFCRPTRTKSSSSLKNLRRVKFCLQKMSDDSDDEVLGNVTANDSSNIKVCPESIVAGSAHILDYIKEEPNQEKGF